jgi:metal-dependent hydrolase (beta-lactamase superfamily II)
VPTAVASAPNPEEFEVSLFGPGYGESVVVHLGNGNWVIVDSCVEKGSGNNTPLSYLNSLGVDVARDVKFVFATHWHDDHIRGIADVVEAAESARFVCSAALERREFRALLRFVDPIATKFSSGIREIRKVVQLLEARNREIFFSLGARRWEQNPTPLVEGIWTLAPVDADVRHALQDFQAAEAGLEHEGLRRIPAFEANNGSVVVLFELHSVSVLLAGDIEHHHSDTTRTWHGIMADNGRPRLFSELYKVAHHGSQNGHCPTTWGKNCQGAAAAAPLFQQGRTLSIVAPWRRGSRSLPTTQDVARMEELSAGVFVTSFPDQAFGSQSEARRFYGHDMARFLAPLDPRPGHVRCRYDGTSWHMT